MIRVPPKITLKGDTSSARNLQSQALSLYNSVVAGMGLNKSVYRSFRLPSGIVKLHAYQDDNYNLITGAINITSISSTTIRLKEENMYITLMSSIPPSSSYPYPPIAAPYQPQSYRSNFLNSEILANGIPTQEKYAGGPSYQGTTTFNNEQVRRHGGNWFNIKKTQYISWTHDKAAPLIVFTNNRFCELPDHSLRGAKILTPFAVKIDSPKSLGISTSIYDKAVIVFYINATTFAAEIHSSIYLLKDSDTNPAEMDAISYIEYTYPSVFSSPQNPGDLSCSGFLRTKSSFACFEMASGGIQNTLEITCSADYSSMSASVIDSRTFYYDPSRYCSMIEAEDNSYSYTYTVISGSNIHALYAVKASSTSSPQTVLLVDNLNGAGFNPTSTLFTSSLHGIHVYQTRVSALGLNKTFLRTRNGEFLVSSTVIPSINHLTNYAINDHLLFISLSYPFSSFDAASNALPGNFLSINLKTHNFVDNPPQDIVTVEMSPGVFRNRRIPLGVTKLK